MHRLTSPGAPAGQPATARIRDLRSYGGGSPGRDDRFPASGPALGLRARFALLAALLVVPVFFALLGTPQGHSYGFNLSWHVAFEAAQAQGALYPRHLPELNSGLGGLDFFFYGPLPFFLAAGPAAWLCPGCAPQTVFGLAGGILLSASMLTFWPLARRVAPPAAAAIGCVIYAVLPYHLGIDWGLRQAAGEFAAYAFLPLVAIGQMDWLSRGRAGLAFPLGLAGVILCHLPTALLAAHVFGVIALAWALAHPRTALPRLAGLAGMGLAGGALAGLYWLPALVLLGDVSPQALYTEFLQPRTWLLPSQGRMPNPGMTVLAVGTAFAGGAVTAAAIAFAPRESRGTLWLWAALPLSTVLFLNTWASAPIWEHWIIDRVQFPFRLFVFADLATALAAASLARHVSAGQPRARRVTAAAGIGGLALCAVAGLGLSADRFANGVKLKGTTVRMIAPREYQPPALAAAVARAAAAAGYDDWRIDRVIRENLDAYHEGAVPGERLEIRPRRWYFAADTPGPATLPVPYWRHMHAETKDGAIVELSPEPYWGRITLEVPPGAPSIIISLPPHWTESAGIVLSLAGLAGCLGIGVVGLRQAGIIQYR